MLELTCPIAEARLRPREASPLLSIVVPNRGREQELAIAVSSLAEQLTGGLERKVEVIISDNASGEAVANTIRALAAKFDAVSYVIHQRDEMGLFQFFAAPWRARGRFTWVFGSDDALLPGGMAQIVETLEREDPFFLTLNKRLWSADFSKELWDRANHVPDRTFETFLDLFCAVGINQLAFISGNIERTETARTADWDVFLSADTRHPHVAAYLRKFHDKKACYFAEPFLIHRADNSLLQDYNAGNFFDYAVTLPRLLLQVMAEIGVSPALFERIEGAKRITSYEPSGVTFVDNIMENALRAIGCGLTMNIVAHRYVLERALAHCRPDRLKQFAEIWACNQRALELQAAEKLASERLQQLRSAALQGSVVFARPTAPEPADERVAA